MLSLRFLVVMISRTWLLAGLWALGCNRDFTLQTVEQPSRSDACVLTYVTKDALGKVNPQANGWRPTSDGIHRTIDLLAFSGPDYRVLYIADGGGLGFASLLSSFFRYRVVSTGDSKCFEVRENTAVCSAPDGSVVLMRPASDGGSTIESWSEAADPSGATRLVFNATDQLVPTSRNSVQGLPSSGPARRWFFTGKSRTTIGLLPDSGTTIVYTAPPSTRRLLVDLPNEPKTSVGLQVLPGGVTHLLLEDATDLLFSPVPPPEAVAQLRVPNAIAPGEDQIVDFVFDGGTYGLFVSGTPRLPAAQVLRLVRCATNACEHLQFGEVALPSGPYFLLKVNVDGSKREGVWVLGGNASAVEIDLNQLTQSLQRCYP
jgi:hypothetical protein